ncbi:MAG TPA: HTH domain-containing protein [bacterium]|nr:HTH domain-containing protein [bacterium]
MKKIDQVLARFDLKELEAALERRRRREERELGRLVGKRKKLESELRKVERRIETSRTTKAKTETKRRPNARRLNEISLADALEKVMKGRKKPIHYKTLTEQVVARKLYRTRSSNLLSTVAVTLKRDKRFKKVEAGYYALR